MQIPVLTTRRLTMRGPTADDFAVLCAFYADERSKFVGGPMNPEQVWRHLACEIGHWTMCGYGRWMVEATATGETVGMVGLWNPEGWPEPEIGWDLFAHAPGHGYATEAAAAARAHAYDVLGWDTVISLVKPANTASAGVARRLGARQDGEFTHDRFGTVQIWRHLGPDELEDGGMGAYA